MTSNLSSIKSQYPLAYTFLAGGLANASELLLGGQLLDRIKTHLQAYPQLRTRQAIREVLERKELWKGARWNLLQGAAKGALRWSINGASDQVCTQLFSKEMKKQHPSLFAGSVALLSALADSTVTCAIDGTKTLEMSRDWKGKIQMWKLLNQRGFGTLLNGWTPTFLKQSSIWLIYLVSYEKIKQMVLALNQGNPVPFHHKILLGAAPGMLSSLVNTPFDLLKTQAQIDKPLGEKRLVRSAQLIVAQFGWRGLYNSLAVKVLRSGWYSLVTYLIMDKLDALPNNMKIK